MDVSINSFREGKESMAGVNKIFWYLMVIKFTESYTYFATSQILVIYLHNEFAMTDVEAGFAYGIWGVCITFWATALSCVNDALGVRRALTIGFTFEIIGYSLLAMARTKAVALLAIFGIMPIGSSLGIPMLMIGVKRYTSDESRGFAFGIFYTVMNVAALMAGPVIDLFNLGRAPTDPVFEGGTITGNRMVIMTCGISAMASFIVTRACLSPAALAATEGEGQLIERRRHQIK